jgi:hypothetical protein
VTLLPVAPLLLLLLVAPDESRAFPVELFLSR